MRAHRGARTLAIDVQVADMELLNGAFDLLPRLGIDGASQAELGVVRDLQRVIVVLRLDHRQHRPKDFFLLQARLGRDVGNDCRL